MAERTEPEEGVSSVKGTTGDVTFVGLQGQEPGAWVLVVQRESITVGVQLTDSYQWGGFVAWDPRHSYPAEPDLEPKLVGEVARQTWGEPPVLDGVPLADWSALFEYLETKKVWCEIHLREDMLWLARVVQVGERGIRLLLVEPDGEVDPEPEDVAFEEIATVSWDTPYASAITTMQRIVSPSYST